MKLKRILLLIFIIAGVMFATSPYLEMVRGKITSYFLLKKSSIVFSTIQKSSLSQQSLEHQIALLSWKVIQLQEEIQKLTEFRENHSIIDFPLVVLGHVISGTGNNVDFRQTFWVDRGKKHGVTCGSIIVSGCSLIGKVIQVEEKTSYCVHISDPSIKISVIVANSLQIDKLQDVETIQPPELVTPTQPPNTQSLPKSYGKGICIGKNGICELRHIEKNQKWSDNVLYVITSTDDKDFPPNLVIGTIPLPNQKEIYDEVGLFLDNKIDIVDLKTVYAISIILND